MIYGITAPCELEVCPWCKKKPTLFKKELWNGRHGYIGCSSYYVECDNLNCKIQPKTNNYNDIETGGKDPLIPIIKACDDWNNRGKDDEKE